MSIKFVRTQPQKEIKLELYSVLTRNKMSEKDLTLSEKTEFMNLIKQLDQEGLNLFFALIKQHSLLEETDSSELPYKGVAESNELVKFNLQSFPIPLRHILFLFLKLHVEKLELDESRE